MRSLRGRANFAASTLREVIDVEPLDLEVDFDDGGTRRFQSVNFCIANSRYFGGGMLIAPDAKLTDGRLDVVNIGNMGAAKIIANAYTLYRGTHLQLDEVGSTLAKKVAVSSVGDAKNAQIEIDGELPGHLPATFKIVPVVGTR